MKKKAYLNCKKITTAIRRAKKNLIIKAEKNGLYENFGQDEVREIRYHFINTSSYCEEENKKRRELDTFSSWCSRYNPERK